MRYLGLCLALALTTTCHAFTPSVTFTCASGPVYTVAVTDAEVGGVIFIDGHCAQQAVATTSQTFTFDAAACTDGSVPAMGTDFFIMVQQYANLNLATDKRINATCTADLANQTQTFTISADGESTVDEDVTDSIAPTFTTAVTSDGTNVITTGEVGDPVKLVVTISDSYEATNFGFKVLSVDFNGEKIVTAGCSDYPAIFTNPGLPTGGSQTLSMTLVRPVTTSEYAVNAVSITISIVLEICNGACTAATCAGDRRRRSADDEGTQISTTRTFATLLVYPPGQTPDSFPGEYAAKDGDIDDVCFSRTPMMVVMICLAAALVACVAISCWMYFKLRYGTAHKKAATDGFSNHSYKA